MCAGAIYWAGIGRVVYGMTEKDLLAQTGSDPRTPPLTFHAAKYLQGAKKKIEVVGPFRTC